MKEAKEQIVKDKELEEMFLETAKGSQLLSKAEKQHIFRRLAEKTANARLSEELKNFREAHTARGHDGMEASLAFRAQLKGYVHNIPEARKSGKK